jgi:hypothetical protein
MLKVLAIMVYILAFIVFITNTGHENERYDISNVIGKDEIIYYNYCFSYSTIVSDKFECVNLIDRSKELINSEINEVKIVAKYDKLNDEIVDKLVLEYGFANKVNPQYSYSVYRQILTSSNYAYKCGKTLTITPF